MPATYLSTRQVGSNNDVEFNDCSRGSACCRRRFVHPLESAAAALDAAGLSADRTHEEFPVTRYRDIGAVVYELRAVSWQVPGFDVAMFDKQLREIDAQTPSSAASQSEATDS